MHLYEACPEVENESFLLRLDLRSDYEKEADIGEILFLVVESAYDWIGCSRFITKAKPIAEE